MWWDYGSDFIQSSVSEIPSYCCINTYNSYDALVDPLMEI